MSRAFMLLPSAYAAQLRDCTEPTERSRIENALAKSARSLVVRAMRSVCARRGAAEDVEDAAQELVTKLVVRIVAEQIPPRHGEEDGYLQRCARNKAYDIVIGKGAYQHRKYDALPATETEDPFARAERESALEHQKALVREALPELHDTYREIIEAYDLRGIPLKEIAQQWFRDGRAKTLAKARQNVEKAHSLGIKRLRLLVQARVREEEAT